MLKMYAKRKKELFERVCVRQIIKLDSEGKEKKLAIFAHFPM